MSYSPDDFDRRLEELSKSTKFNLDKVSDRLKTDLENTFVNFLNDEIRRAETASQEDNELEAALHYSLARMVNESMKKIKRIG